MPNQFDCDQGKFWNCRYPSHAAGTIPGGSGQNRHHLAAGISTTSVGNSLPSCS